MAIGRLAGESAAYASVRDELQRAEVALRDERERVAALRRRLPLDHRVEDARFEELRAGVLVPVRLSELFDEGRETLLLMQFMFGKKQQKPCPMCTLWADGYDGVVPQLRQRASFAVLAAGAAGAFEAWGRERGWRHLRLVSAAESTLKRDLGFEAADGTQFPGVSVFRRDPAGTPIHVYSQSAVLGPDGGRGMDLLSPVWHFLDLTPEGRGDWMPSVRAER